MKKLIGWILLIGGFISFVFFGQNAPEGVSLSYNIGYYLIPGGLTLAGLVLIN